mgnify:CR=1 FL=1
MELERELRGLDVSGRRRPSSGSCSSRTDGAAAGRCSSSLRSRSLRSPPPSRCRSRAARSSASFTSAATRSSSSTRCRPPRSARSPPDSARSSRSRRRGRSFPASRSRPWRRQPELHQSGTVVSLRVPPGRRPRAPQRSPAGRGAPQEARRQPDQRRLGAGPPGRLGRLALGKAHVFFFPREPARLAGNTLVWTRGSYTYRLEGPNLSRDAALKLARSLRYPRKG